MEKCFVAMPIDEPHETFHKRFETTYSNAISEAGFKPYRVDQDPSVENILERIIDEIKAAKAVFADISNDNANVWFEVGYALALDKPLIMVCDRSIRTGEYPFDVSHRNIVEFKPESLKDFENLQKDISQRLKAIVQKRKNMTAVKIFNTDTDGLSPMEIAALISVFQNQEGCSSDVTFSNIRDDMHSAGFNRLAVNLALTSLQNSGYITSYSVENDWSRYLVYSVTDDGYSWLSENKNLLNFTTEQPDPNEPVTLSDDVPF